MKRKFIMTAPDDILTWLETILKEGKYVSIQEYIRTLIRNDMHKTIDDGK